MLHLDEYLSNPYAEQKFHDELRHLSVDFTHPRHAGTRKKDRPQHQGCPLLFMNDVCGSFTFSVY